MNVLLAVLPIVVGLVIVGLLAFVLVRRGNRCGTARDPEQLSAAELQARGMAQTSHQVQNHGGFGP